jgi:hypothetical protein
MTNNMFQPKTRGTVPQSRFADAAKKAKGRSGGGGYKKVVGKYDRLKLGEQPIWIRFAPDQLYTQLVWDGELKAVVEVTRPWFEVVSHFVPGKQRGFNCSAGPNRDQACRGCAVRAWFFDRLRRAEKEIAEKTGIDTRREKKGERDPSNSPPIQASKQFGMGVTVLEKCFEMQSMGRNGKPKTDRDGKPIMQIVPAPLSGIAPPKRKDMPGEFGHNFHWGFGTRALAALGNIDADLWNSCANCACDLVATEFHCAECNAVCFDEPSGLRGADLRAMREQEMKCSACGHEGPLVPALSCTGCENPAEGSILAFDLRLKSVKLDDNSSTLVLEEFRVPDYSSLYKDDDVINRVCELVMNPLDIQAIYAPDSVDSQAYMLPEDLKAIDVMYHVKNKRSSAAYGSGDGDGAGEGGDPNQMSFSEEES